MARRLCEFLGLRQVGTLLDGIVERTRIHADSNGNASLARCIDNGIGALPAADIARVDAQLRRAAPRRLDGDDMVEVDIGHHGQWALRAYPLERIEVLPVRDGHADYLATSLGQTLDLREVARHVVGRGVQHRLHGAGRTAADGHAAHQHLPRFLVRFHNVRTSWRHIVPARDAPHPHNPYSARKKYQVQGRRSACRSGRASPHAKHRGAA